MKGAYGDKRFVFAMLQTGITWAPSAEQLSGIGAAERAASRFVNWVRAVVSAIESQRQSTDYQEALRKSGASYGEHRLTEAEVCARNNRRKTESNYFLTVKLDRQLKASKGKQRQGVYKRQGFEHAWCCRAHQ